MFYCPITNIIYAQTNQTNDKITTDDNLEVKGKLDDNENEGVSHIEDQASLRHNNPHDWEPPNLTNQILHEYLWRNISKNYKIFMKERKKANSCTSWYLTHSFNFGITNPFGCKQGRDEVAKHAGN